MESTECEKPKVINLSSKILTQQQIDILSKGLKFTPTPQKKNYNEIKDDISKFTRKLRLTEELYDKSDNDESIVRNISKYNAPKGRNTALDIFCEHITIFPYETLSRTKFKSNFSKAQWKNITQLGNKKGIIKGRRQR